MRFASITVPLLTVLLIGCSETDSQRAAAPADSGFEAPADATVDVSLSDGTPDDVADVSVDASSDGSDGADGSDAAADAVDGDEPDVAEGGDAEDDALDGTLDTSLDTSIDTSALDAIPEADAEAGTGFTIEEVDPFDASTVAIALDETDRPHLAYWSGATQTIRWASRTATGWLAEPVTPTVGVAGLFDLALEPSGLPCVAYRASGSVRYACRSAAGVWSDELVATGSGRIGLAIDVAGTPHVVYTNDGAMMYATRTGATWTSETIMPLTDHFARIALDPAGLPHVIAGKPSGVATIRYASRATGAWVVDTVVTAGSSVESFVSADLAFDGTGGRHVAFATSGGPNKIKWLAPTGSVEEVTPLTTGGSLTIATSPTGVPHLSYRFASFITAVRYAHRTGGVWTVETVADTNGTPALAVGKAGGVHIGYADHTAKMVRYAFR